MDKIGDIVLYDNIYQFTISDINDDGWIWGEDIPDNFKYYGYDKKINYHSPFYCINLTEIKRKKRRNRIDDVLYSSREHI